MASEHPRSRDEQSVELVQQPAAQTDTTALGGYASLLDGLKARIRAAQTRAALAANRELIVLYWQIGHEILVQQTAEGWGAKVIDRLATDLRREFPEMSGFSPRNPKYMRAFAVAYPDQGMVQQIAAQIPWTHNCLLLDKIKDPAERAWYAQQTIVNGWSRAILGLQVEANLYQRQGKAQTNVPTTLPPPQSDLAQQVLKDPYVFDFLTLGPTAQERDLEQGLIDHVRDFLIELGVGFAFVGSQVPLVVGGQDYYLDLLFYHLHLRCYVVIELKIGDFKPEYAGKVNFYLSAVDDHMRHEQDQPSIGLILCKQKNHVIVEYALRDTQKPIGVSAWEITETLPTHLKGSLPTVEQLEAELEAHEGDNGSNG